MALRASVRPTCSRGTYVFVCGERLRERLRPYFQQPLMASREVVRPAADPIHGDGLAVSMRTVRRYIADGQLEAVRLGRKTLG